MGQGTQRPPRQVLLILGKVKPYSLSLQDPIHVLYDPCILLSGAPKFFACLELLSLKFNLLGCLLPSSCEAPRLIRGIPRQKPYILGEQAKLMYRVGGGGGSEGISLFASYRRDPRTQGTLPHLTKPDLC